MQHAFSDGPIEAVIRPLIEPEEFTAGSDSATNEEAARIRGESSR
jgi:hypothetical protein